MVTAFVNGTAIRDHANNTAQIIFSTPITKSAYLIGSFLGSTFVALLPLVGVSIGMVIGSWMPWVDELRTGPNMFMPHVQGFLILGLPNVLFSAAIIFAVAVLQRSTMASFITAVTLFVGYSISGSMMEDMENQTIAAMLDPFGTTALSEATEYWTVGEKNPAPSAERACPLEQATWISVSIAIFIFGYFRFSLHRSSKQKASAGYRPRRKTSLYSCAPTESGSAFRRQGAAQLVRQPVPDGPEGILTGGALHYHHVAWPFTALHLAGLRY
ncbi:MAG: hypothetical protein IPI00_02290 [Flavobacteriales bacterium]|nr:hypothetical protein [Flavobacteriales bacterium]